MSNNKQSTYNLMWAIAILREDYHHCWRLIAERMRLQRVESPVSLFTDQKRF
jgi:hypothetical protein